MFGFCQFHMQQPGHAASHYHDRLVFAHAGQLLSSDHTCQRFDKGTLIICDIIR